MKQQKDDPRTISTDSAPAGTKTEAKLGRLFDLMRALVAEGFTGSIKLNFTQGGIGSIEKFEEILKGGDGPRG